MHLTVGVETFLTIRALIYLYYFQMDALRLNPVKILGFLNFICVLFIDFVLDWV